MSEALSTTANSSHETLYSPTSNHHSPMSDKKVAPRKNRKGSFCLRSPPPSQHLKKILENYPEGPQIFQEALQNADDARASTFRVILDERTHRSKNERLDRFMGPAILFVNDGTFTENDWKSLQNMFESDKANQPGKIGRFGMGSRSYFHVADVITVISGRQVAFLDPDWAITDLGGLSSDLSSLLGDNKTSEIEDDFILHENIAENEISILKDMMIPLDGMMGFHFERSEFHGSLFRLPLRMGKWAKNSTFAPYEYSTSKALGLLRRFQKEAAQSLLFLQSLSKIELWRWRTSDESPCPLYFCTIFQSPSDGTSTTSRVNSHRGLIRDYLEEQRLSGHNLRSILCQADTGILPEVEETVELEEIDFPLRNFNTALNIETFHTSSTWLLNIRIVPNSDLFNLLPTTQRPPVVGIALLACPPHTSREHITPPKLTEFSTESPSGFSLDSSHLQKNWLASTPLYPKSCSNITRLLWALHDDDGDFSFCEDITNGSPRAIDVEYSMGLGQSLNGAPNHYSLDHESFDQFKRLKGKTYAFLPLPDVLSGLPIHIHGTFQLTDNRRSLWTSVEDTDGQAQRWSEWNIILLHQSLPQLYAKVVLRYSKFVQISLNNLSTLADANFSNGSRQLTSDEIENAAAKILKHFYNSWPNPKEVTRLFSQMLPEFVRVVKDQKVMIRQIQSQSGMACRLASKRNSTAYTSSRLDVSLPPIRPVECQFLQLTDIELHVFNRTNDNLDLLGEAVAQCQLLGHPIILCPESIRELFQQFDHDQSNNPAAITDRKSMGISHQSTDYHIRNSGSNRLKSKSTPLSNSQNGYFIITALDMYRSILIPHWISMPHKELSNVPKFTTLMLCLCKILGRGPDKYILRFRESCHTLPFIPVRFPGIEYDDEEQVPLKPPVQCCDPTLDHYRVGSLSQPGTEFRAPDVLRVLRLWGLKQNLSYFELAQEALNRACVIGGCKVQRKQLEAFFHQQ